jgi:transcriptional regulator with PAS, ATPase and Fis domain
LHRPLTAIANSISTTLNEPDANKYSIVVKETQTNKQFEGIIGNSSSLLNILNLVSQVAPLDTSVLILGESGTGKEKIAECIHNLSPRKNKPLIKINCAAFPPGLIESELFGHEKGAFTGATEKRTGRFEQADGGTIFLDEIGDMHADLQVKLLRVLQEKEIERIGGTQTIKVNVRVIAATNRNLESEMAEGRFRLDLYYRLNVFPITLPPLRNRIEDIAQLAATIAGRFSKKFNKSFQGISEQMLAQLETYHWPGNIRELENIIEQSVILNDSRSKLHLRQPLVAPGTKSTTTAPNSVKTIEDIKRVQRDTEIAYISQILAKTHGRIRGKNGAAELLNEKPTTLESRLAKLGIKKEDFR